MIQKIIVEVDKCNCKENSGKTNFCPTCGKKNMIRSFSSLQNNDSFAGFQLKNSASDGEVEYSIVCLASTETVNAFYKRKDRDQVIHLNQYVLNQIPVFLEIIQKSLKEKNIEYDESNFGVWSIVDVG